MVANWLIDSSGLDFSWALSAINLNGGVVIYLTELDLVGASASKAPLVSLGFHKVICEDELWGCELFEDALGYSITGVDCE